MKNQIKLNKEQQEAVEHKDGPLLIIAGAGTGKTTVITERMKHLITNKDVKPSEILALTFTEKAAREMEERVDKALPYGFTQMWISTFHSFCDRILRQEAINIGINPNYKLLTEAETILFIKENLFKFELDYFRPLGNPTKFLSAMIQHFSRLKDEDISPKEYLDFAEKNFKMAKSDEEKLEASKYIELSRAYEVFEDLKIKEGFSDFSDLISNTLKVFRLRKNVLSEYQNQFKHIMVDEFQDTNYVQNELAILLAGDKKNITVVGDDDQSIYRFRGSSVSNIIQFKERFPKAKIITLTKNYRSTEEILERSYKLITNNNPDRLEVKEKINKKLTSERKVKGKRIDFIFRNRVEDEADQTVKEIEKLVKEGYEFKDFAILVRANDHSQPFIRALDRKGIPYQFLGPGKLFHQEEIKDLISYLKVLYNFEDSASFYRVLNMDVFEFQPIEIAALVNLAKRRNYTLFEAAEKIEEIALKEETKVKLIKLTKLIKKHLGLISKESAGQILYYFLEDIGIIRNLIENKTEKDEKIAKNLAKFFDKLKTYEVEHNSAKVFEVVDWIDLSMQMGESPLATDSDWSENNAVSIFTVHSSKGLEFPIVFLVNLVAERFPTRERKETIPIPKEFIKEILPVGDYHLEEERRLFYVGMTRAKDVLFLTASNFYGEGKRERKLSPFIYEALEQDEIDRASNVKTLKEDQLSLLNWQPSIPTTKPSLNITSPLTYLSYSQIQTFDICPLHYKLKYIMKIPTPQSSSQSFGTSIHGALRDIYNASKAENINQEKAVRLLLNNWINEGYQSKKHEEKALEKAKNLICDYLDKELNLKNLPLAIELPFNFNLRNLKIGGRIDRIDKIKDNFIEIVDYKTGSNIPNEKKLQNDIQLTIYALAATRINEKFLAKKPEEINLSFYYLEEGKKLTTSRTKKQLEEAEEFLIEKAKEISESDFKCSKSHFCASCEYKILCNCG